MTEEHKQKIREAALKRHAEKQQAALNPGVTVGQHEFVPNDDDAGPKTWQDVVLPKTPEPTPSPVPDPVIAPEPTPSSPDTDAQFSAWLKTSDGWRCSDPRIPQDRVRLGVHLEDILRAAFNAGFTAGYGEGSV